MLIQYFKTLSQSSATLETGSTVTVKKVSVHKVKHKDFVCVEWIRLFGHVQHNFFVYAYKNTFEWITCLKILSMANNSHMYDFLLKKLSSFNSACFNVFH